ncbi:MAG: heme-binding protein [Beduini sp.]|mgnify:CR=1 FL=1|uniref:heme-binding protein n=1 Tax=Beduini sp. TaxID=1922300 RepID=UPI0039A18018
MVSPLPSLLYAFLATGGFSILIHNEVKGAICVSGLEHTQNHDLIIQALEAYLYPKQD